MLQIDALLAFDVEGNPGARPSISYYTKK